MAKKVVTKRSKVSAGSVIGEGAQGWTVGRPQGPLPVNADEAIVTDAGALLFKTNQAMWLAFSPTGWTSLQRRA